MENNQWKWHLDRELPISLNEQLKGQITYAVIYGEIEPGTVLPSIREMAGLLKVSTMTVAGVYRELITEGLIISKPRVGYFVAPMNGSRGLAHPRNTHKLLQQIVDNCIRQALLLGYSIDELQGMFASVSEQYNPDVQPNTIVFAGNFMPATGFYAEDIEAILKDQNIKVVPVLIKDIQNEKPEVVSILQNASLVLTIASRLQEVRTLLEPYAVHVAAVAFQLHPNTRSRLANISPEQRVGIVTTYSEFLQTMVEHVVSYGLNIIPPLCSVLGQDERIREMFSQIDVLVYSSGSEEVLAWVPEGLEVIEYLHSPEPDSVKRLISFDLVKSPYDDAKLRSPKATQPA